MAEKMVMKIIEENKMFDSFKIAYRKIDDDKYTILYPPNETEFMIV